MRKRIASILTIITLIVFFNNYMVVNATSSIMQTDETLEEIMNGVEADNYNKLMESGTTSTNGETRQENVSVGLENQGTVIPFVTKILCRLLLVIPQVSNATMSQIASNGKKVFTIEGLVTNEYDLFNIKYLIQPTGMDKNSNNILQTISKNTSIWFVGIRNLSLVGSIITLIYVGIRLAIATVSKDKSEYKKILFSWFEAFVILLTLHFFIVLIIYASDYIVDMLVKTIEKNNTGTATIEQQIMTNINKNLDKATQTRTTIFYTLLFIIFAYYQIKFFVLYIGRLLRVSFYIIISPLVCITYPIDKIGDGRAQGFNNWALEFVITTFMQPIHLLVYLIMVYSMGEIFVRNPVIGIAFLASLSHTEKTFKSVLKINPKLDRGLDEIELKGIIE